MAVASTVQPEVIRTERGLSLAGTRITLYDILDYVHAGWPPTLIRDRLNLTSDQITVAMAYIDRHRDEVEAEYQQVLQTAKEIRQYWDMRNRERLAEIAAMPPQAGREALWAKLAAWKAKLESP